MPDIAGSPIVSTAVSKLRARLEAVLTNVVLTSVVEEWSCKHGEIGVYIGDQEGKRVYVAGILNTSKAETDQLSASAYTEQDILGVLGSIRQIADVCGATRIAVPLVIEFTPEGKSIIQ